VGALHYGIGPALQGRLGELLGKKKMAPMGFIRKQQNSAAFRQFPQLI
jgi:hypothetical protein